MTYVRAWDEFLARSEALFRDSPTKTRYTIKYRHCSGKLVLKVTDDKEVRGVRGAVAFSPPPDHLSSLRCSASSTRRIRSRTSRRWRR